MSEKHKPTIPIHVRGEIIMLYSDDICMGCKHKQETKCSVYGKFGVFDEDVFEPFRLNACIKESKS